MAAPPASATPARWRRRSPTRSRTTSWSPSSVLSGNRNFEGRVHAERARQLPGQPAAGRRLRAARHDERGHHHGAARHRLGRQAGLSERHLADATQRSSDAVEAERHPRAVPRPLRRGVQGPAQWQAIEVDVGSDIYRWNGGSTYVQNPPYFEGITMTPDARDRHHRRPRAGAASPTTSPPTTSARPATSASQLARGRISAGAPGHAATTSTATAPAAATTRS